MVLTIKKLKIYVLICSLLFLLWNLHLLWYYDDTSVLLETEKWTIDFDDNLILESRSNFTDCPDGFVRNDWNKTAGIGSTYYTTGSASTTNPTIPKLIHLITIDQPHHYTNNEQCISVQLNECIRQWKITFANDEHYTLQLHTPANIPLSILYHPTRFHHRRIFQNIHKAIECSNADTQNTFTLQRQLYILLTLWNNGGICVQPLLVSPGSHLVPNLQNMISSSHQGILFLKQQHDYRMDFVATMPQHPILFTLMFKIAGDYFMHLSNSSFVPQNEQSQWNGYLDNIIRWIFVNEEQLDVVRNSNPKQGAVLSNSFSHTRYGLNNSSITILNLTDIRDEVKYLTNAIITDNETPANPRYYVDKSSKENHFGTSSSISLPKCIDWDEKMYEKEKHLISSIQSITRNVKDKSNIACPNGLILFQDKVFHNTREILSRRRIPKIIHMTSKSRCMTQDMIDNVNKWKFADYSIFLHDDDAVYNLIHRDWKEFPFIHDAVNCITSGAGMADLWRYLVLWEFGGIYTDIDNAPGPLLANSSLFLNDTVDAFVEVEHGKFPSQYFIAVSPHHPLMYMAVQTAIQRLFMEQNIVEQYVPYITGPASMKWASVSQ
jgi:mannosyltransferase OCH1-like enzyme